MTRLTSAPCPLELIACGDAVSPSGQPLAESLGPLFPTHRSGLATLVTGAVGLSLPAGN